MQETPVGSLCKSLNAYVSLQMHEAQEKSPESRRIPEWIRWIQHGAALSAHRRILYVDWTECTPEEHRIQHVLADIVLRQWHACHSSHLLQTERGGKTLSTIGMWQVVCPVGDELMIFLYIQCVIIPSTTSSSTTRVHSSEASPGFPMALPLPPSTPWRMHDEPTTTSSSSPNHLSTSLPSSMIGWTFSSSTDSPRPGGLQRSKSISIFTREGHPRQSRRRKGVFWIRSWLWMRSMFSCMHRPGPSPTPP